METVATQAVSKPSRWKIVIPGNDDYFFDPLLSEAGDDFGGFRADRRLKFDASFDATVDCDPDETIAR